MLRFTGVSDPHDPTNTNVFLSHGCGIKEMSFVQYPGTRGRRCDAAVHVEYCDYFTMEDCTFDWIDGSALKCTGATQCSFNNVRVHQCGANDAMGENPAVWLAGSGSTIVQGSVFSGFKIEACMEAPYLQIDEGNKANKFDDIGFETAPRYADSWQSFLVVRGDANHFGKVHFNRQSELSTVAKMKLEASNCQFGELTFRGRAGEAGSLWVGESAADNHFNSIIVETFLAAYMVDGGPALPVDWLSFTTLRVDGDRNQFGKILCSQYEQRGHIGRIEIAGSQNQVGEIIDSGTRGVEVTGWNNKIVSLVSSHCPETALTVAGMGCDVLQAHVEACGVEAGPAVLIEDPQLDVLPVGVANRSRARIRVLQAGYAEEGIRVTGTEIQLLPGTLVENIPNGQGILWTGRGGGWNGIEVYNLGRDGILVDGGTPTSMTNWTVRRCNVNFRGEHHGGFRATTPSFDAVPVTCTGFVIQEDGSTHAYSFKIEPSGSNSPGYSRWLIRGNVADGGQVSIPATEYHSVDFDSDGMGADIPTDITKTIALGDTANFFTVTGTDDIEIITASWKGRRAILRLDPGAGNTVTLKDGVGNLLLASDFVADPNDTLSLISNGTQWLELGRSVN